MSDQLLLQSPPMSLYQTYRPETFADVTGQEHIVTTLERAVEQEKLAHAYLFAGPRGTGKTSIARILATHILTRGLPKEKADEIAVQVREGTAVDLIEIDAASNRGIDDVRTLIERIQFSPIHAAAKVYIVDEVHMLTREAFNALLKTLEEPPEYAFFILATTELQKIPATIQSRCQRFAFHEIGEEAITKRLQFIADKEGVTVERPALRAMARAAGGGLRDAIGRLDQLRSLPAITEKDVEERLGHSGREEAEKLFAALSSQDANMIVGVIRSAEESGLSIESLTRESLTLARNWLHTSVQEKSSLAGASRLIELLLEAIRDLRSSPVPALVLEHALLQTLQAEAPALVTVAAAKPSAPVAPPKIETPKVETVALEKAPAVQRVEEKVETPMRSAIVEVPEISLQVVLEKWPELALKVTPASVKMSLKNGRVSSVEGNIVTLRFSSRFHRDRVASKEALHQLEDLLQEVFKQRVRVDCLVEEETTEAAKEGSVNLADVASEVF